MATPTTIKYTRFSFNYIDSPLFQERIAQILAGEIDPRDVNWDELLGDDGPSDASSHPPSSDSDHEHDLFHGFSLGLFIPLVICCTFLLVLCICVIRHSMNKKCTPISKASFSSVFRGGTEYDDTSRSSVRSRTPLKRAQDDRQSTRTNTSKSKAPIFMTKVSQLSSIRESPEDYYKKFCNKALSASGTITPDSMSSMSSLFSRLTTGENLNILSNSAMYPVAEKIPTPIPVLTRSFPNLINSMQSPKDAMMHPYRITWITPLSAQSEPVLVDHMTASNLERRLFAKLEKKNQLADINVLSSASANNTSKLSDKSPFHPNNNTPTTGSDGDNIPGDVFINQTHSVIANDSYNNTAGTPMLTMNASHLRNQLRSIGSTPGTDYSQPSLRSVSLSFPNTSIGSWHYNDIYRAEKQPSLVKNILSHTKALIANPSPYPPPMPANNDANAQGSRGSNKGNDMSMYPNIGSSNTSMSHQTSENQLMNKVPLSSGNTSICAHMDSNETTQTYNSSIFTGVNSDLAFGYDQNHERGHSTSIEQGPDSMTCDATTTSNNIRALSAIQGSGSTAFDSGSLTAGAPTSGEENSEPSFASTTRSAPAIMMKQFLSSVKSDTPTIMSRTDVSSAISASYHAMVSEENVQQMRNTSNGANNGMFGGRSDEELRAAGMNTEQADSSTETPVSTKSLEWDGYFYYTDQSEADRRGSSGTVRDMDLENGGRNSEARRSQNKNQTTKRLSDQMLQHQLQKRLSGQYLFEDSSQSSGSNRRKSDISAYSSQSSQKLSDQLSRDDVKRHSAQAILVENYRRRSDQPVLDAKQYWV